MSDAVNPSSGFMAQAVYLLSTRIAKMYNASGTRPENGMGLLLYGLGNALMGNKTGSASTSAPAPAQTGNGGTTAVKSPVEQAAAPTAQALTQADGSGARIGNSLLRADDDEEAMPGAFKWRFGKGAQLLGG
jgi:hypothetical protein